MIWHRLSLATLVLFWRLAESDINVMSSIMCIDWLHWWYNHVADVVPPSTPLALVIKMGEKSKSTSPSAIQVKNQWKRIGIEEKLDVISQLQKGDRIVDICQNVSFTHISIRTIHKNNRITGSANLGTNCLCSKTTTVLAKWATPKTMGVSLLHFYWIRNEYIVCQCIHTVYTVNIYSTGPYIH